MKHWKTKKELPIRINEVKMCRKSPEQEEVVIDLEKFNNSRKEVINFFKDYAKIILDAG